MALDKIITLMRAAIEAEMQKIIENSIPPEYRGMQPLLTYHMGWEGEGAGLEAQGKRIRPLIVVLCTASIDKDWQKALPSAAAVELIHNFSLIHDDIQDRSELRRGRPTVWVKWGVPQAINAGDLMFTLSHTAILQTCKTVSLAAGIKSAEVLNHTCIQLTGGQYLDMRYETQVEVSPEAYWPMVSGKTAALIECCAVLGGIAGGADEQHLLAFAEFGSNLGLAFQVLDDWLGIWGNAALIGKSTDSDLVSGKKSLPVLYGLSKKGAFYQRWLQGNISQQEAHQLAEMLADEGAQEYTRKVADELNSKALDALSRVACEKNDACEALNKLAYELLNREQ